MQTIVKTSSPQDFLALVPTLAGFHPRNSVVLVAFRGSRTCGAIRFDLPTAAFPQAYKRIAVSLIGTLCKIKAADALVPVVYTDDSVVAEQLPYFDFAQAIIKRARLSGFLVRDALCQGPDAWASYLDDSSIRHPVGTIDFEKHQEIGEHPLSTVDADAQIPLVASGFTEEVARFLQRYEAIRGNEDALAAEPGMEELNDLADVSEMFERFLSRSVDTICEREASLILFLVNGPPIRDDLLLQAAFGIEVGLLLMDDSVRFAEGEPTQHDELSRLLLGDGPRPDTERIGRAIALLKLLVGCAPTEFLPAPLVMLAWLNWALGRGSVAGVFLDRVLAIDSSYGMATLLDGYFSAGYLPEWAFFEPGRAS